MRLLKFRVWTTKDDSEWRTRSSSRNIWGVTGGVIWVFSIFIILSNYYDKSEEIQALQAKATSKSSERLEKTISVFWESKRSRRRCPRKHRKTQRVEVSKTETPYTVTTSDAEGDGLCSILHLQMLAHDIRFGCSSTRSPTHCAHA